MPTSEQLRRLISPRSVAIVGASPTPGSLGASVLANLDRLKYSGEIHLINPNREKIGERPCLKSPDMLPPGVDCAVLAIPRPAVLDALRALARRQVGSAIIFSAGFAEGGTEGLNEQRELTRIATEAGMVIEGPNCLGLINYVDGVALSFIDSRSAPLNGRPAVGIVSQSGAMAAVVGTILLGKDLAVSYSISTGNEAASGVEDYFAYLLEDPHTRVVGIIAEQLRRPRRFLELAAAARAKGKPVVLLHPGKSSAARESAATHTGAMAGDYQVMRTLVERQGVVVADALEEFADILDIAGRCKTLPAGGAAVMTESGAFKALALDQCELVNLPLPAMTAENAPALRAALPPFVPVSNPVDLTAQALVDPDLYRRAMAALIGDDRVGSVIACIIQADAAKQKFSSIIGAIKQINTPKPILFAGMDEGAPVAPEYIAELRALGTPWFPSPERAIRAVAKLSAAAQRDIAKAATTSLPPTGITLPKGTIPEYIAKKLLAPLGIPFPKGRFVTTPQDAQNAAAEIGYPVALKAQAAALSHKSDAGGVILNVKSPEELTAAWNQLYDNIARHRPGMQLDGVLLEKMSPKGVELIIGARNDPDWGPVILAGFGGVQAEVLHDVRLLPPDLSAAAIERELHQLKSAPLLRGFRGSPEVDTAAVSALIEKLSRLLLAEPCIREIDLNPVIAYPKGQGALALDALILAKE